jgi:hypothetical protein
MSFAPQIRVERLLAGLDQPDGRTDTVKETVGYLVPEGILDLVALYHSSMTSRHVLADTEQVEFFKVVVFKVAGNPG